jgi:hypothetical protein
VFRALSAEQSPIRNAAREPTQLGWLTERGKMRPMLTRRLLKKCTAFCAMPIMTDV